MRNPHPENRTGTAYEDGSRYAGDVARADRSRKSCSNCLEGREVCAVILIGLSEKRADCVLHDVTELSYLYKAGSEAEVNTRADEKRKHYGSPCKAVHRIVDVGDDLNKFVHAILLFARKKGTHRKGASQSKRYKITSGRLYPQCRFPSFCLRESETTVSLHLRHSPFVRFSGTPSASGFTNDSESFNGLFNF